MNKFIKLILLIAFIVGLCLIGYTSDKADTERWELERKRCENGVYDPCDLRCRSFRDVIMGIPCED